MSELEVRQAVVADAEEIAGIHTRSFLSAYSHLPITHRSAENGFERRVEVWADRLARREERTLVAVDGGKVIGFIHVGGSPDADVAAAGHIHSIHVDPKMTGTGVGARLVSAARDAFFDDGYRTATLWALADNDRARRFYERLGWRPDGGRRREQLAVGEEEGDQVEVVRYRLQLDGEAEEA